MTATVSALYQYPVKSCAGWHGDRLSFDRYGFARDRRWLVVDPDGRFLTQRELPAMARIRPRPTNGDGGLVLTAPGAPELAVPVTGTPATVQVWADRVSALDLGAAPAAWLEQVLDRPARLAAMAPDWRRPVDPDYGDPGDETGFSDGFPFLLISEGSLADLNQRLPRPLPMSRFRPNIVVAGCAPFAEDRWRRIRIDGHEFAVVKPCTRCKITTTDQDRGQRDGPEPLRTLAGFRRHGQGVVFGQNLIHRSRAGSLAVGALVEVLE